MDQNEHDIGIGNPTSSISVTDILKAIKKTQKEKAQIITALGKAQTNEEIEKLMNNLEETEEALTSLTNTLPETMRDMI